MALHDILQAITAEADRQIADLQAAHKQSMKDLKDSHEKEYFSALKQIDRQKDEKIHQMRSRVEGHAQMIVRHAVLRKKRELLDQFYAQIAASLAKMPSAQLESLYSNCLARITVAGEVLPTKGQEELLKKLLAKRDDLTLGAVTPGNGGFRFIGKTEDHDYTFEFLVSQLLRPATELSVARELFSL